MINTHIIDQGRKGVQTLSYFWLHFLQHILFLEVENSFIVGNFEQ